jgi:phospholipid/cholesterol/gamma-HCH transport system substrate-binding protein
METRASYLSVGAFLLALCLGLVIFVMWFSRVDFTQDNQNYKIYFKGSVSGLRVNESVRFHGLPIGKVKSIYVDPHNVEQIAVKISIDNPELIREDAVASVEAQGLTGYSYIQIKGGSKDRPPLKALPGKRYPVIISQASGIEMLFSELPHILENIYTLSGRLNSLLDKDNVASISSTLNNISKMTTALAKGPNKLENFVGEARATFVQLQKTLKTLDAKTNPALDALTQASVSLDKTSKSLDALLEENRASVKEFTNAGLPTITATMVEAQKNLKTLQGILEKIEVSPGNFLHESTSQGYRLP